MRDVPSWDSYFMDLAHKAAERSKDPSTQVGAVLVDADRNVVMSGYNGFAPGARETPALWNDRDEKYPRVLHAEINAVARAAKTGRATGGATLYCTHFPCPDCAKVIAAAGVVRVIAARVIERWDYFEATKRFDEAKVEWRVEDCR